MPKRKAQTAVSAVPKASLGARIKKDIIKNYQLYLLMIPGFLLMSRPRMQSAIYSQ